VGINGEPDDSSSSAVPADAVDGLDEIAKRQELLVVIGLHITTIRRVALLVLWGVDPIMD
jgi:toxin ParE1/3/4